MRYLILIGVALAAMGCREKPAPAPVDKPVEKPVATATNRPGGVGGALADVLTQRPVIEAGKRAKSQIEAANAKENQAIQDVLQE